MNEENENFPIIDSAYFIKMLGERAANNADENLLDALKYNLLNLKSEVKYLLSLLEGRS